MKLLLLVLIITTGGVLTDRTCGNFIPQNKSECNALTTSFNYCCFYNNPNGDKLANGCVSVGVSDFTKFQNSRTINGTQYTYDCGITYTSNEVTQCGVQYPTKPVECNEHTTKDSSCCYYNFFGQKGCISYGAIVKGSIPYGSMILQCGSEIARLSIYTAIIIILFIF
jgi:hypothetical protein